MSKDIHKSGMQFIYESVTGNHLRFRAEDRGRHCAFCGGSLPEGGLSVKGHYRENFTDIPQFAFKYEQELCPACDWLGKRPGGVSTLQGYMGGNYALFTRDGRENFDDIGQLFTRWCEGVEGPSVMIACNNHSAKRKYTPLRFNRGVTTAPDHVYFVAIDFNVLGEEVLLNGTIEFDTGTMKKEVAAYKDIIKEVAEPICELKRYRKCPYNVFRIMRDELPNGKSLLPQTLLAMSIAASLVYPIRTSTTSKGGA